MNKDMEQILKDAKMLLRLEDSSCDNILIFIAEDCINAVMSYCRIDVIPYQLMGLIAQMTAKRYEREYLKNDGGGLDVQSIAEGDRKIEFSVPKNNSVTDDYTERLKPFVNIMGRVPSDKNSEDIND